MPNIILTAESGSDITPEQARFYGIEIVPMHVTLGEETRDDGAFPPEEICRYYERTGALPKTSGSTPEDFQTVFDRIHARWPEAHILHLTYSSVTTVSFSCARMAAVDKPYITIMDTKQVSAGQASVVLQAAELLAQKPDISLREMVPFVSDLCDRTRMCFIPADLDYLRAGGRCSNAACLGGRLLHLHPCIEMRGGALVAAKKYRGNYTKVVPRLIGEWTESNALEKKALWFLRSPGLPGPIQELAEKTAGDLGYEAVHWVDTGCVITTHGGPGCFGVVGVASREVT